MATTDSTTTIFEGYAPSKWTVKGRVIIFVILSVRETGGNRLVKRARPYRDGEKLDDTGSKGKEFTLETIWNNSIDEPGVPQIPALYPFVLNDMIDTCDIHETGTLDVPTRQGIRCRFENYVRNEMEGEIDSARMTCVFWADNEDNIDATSFVQPSVRATIRRAEGETTFSVESRGGFSQFLADLEGAASDLEEAIAAPGEAIQDVDQKAARVIRIVQNVENQLTVTGQLGSDLLLEPDSWAAIRQLRVMQDRTAQAVAEKSSGIARVVTKVFGQSRSIFDIAVELAQDPTDLMNLNNAIENLLDIPAGVGVRVYEK